MRNCATACQLSVDAENCPSKQHYLSVLNITQQRTPAAPRLPATPPESPLICLQSARSALDTALVQQTGQIVAAHDLTLSVSTHVAEQVVERLRTF
jgi:hypothetical protein